MSKAKRNTNSAANTNANSLIPTMRQPQVQTLGSWSGIDTISADCGVMLNYLRIQNNVYVDPKKMLTVRDEGYVLCTPPSGIEFTGVYKQYKEYIFFAFSDHSIRIYNTDTGQYATCYTGDVPVSSINTYQQSVFAFGDDGHIIRGNLNEMQTKMERKIPLPNPTNAPILTPRGNLAIGNVVKTTICYVYCNDIGTTLASDASVGLYSIAPQEWNSSQFLNISGQNIPTGVTGVDIYAALNDNISYMLIGHVNCSDTQNSWSYDWLGALTDISIWTTSSISLPSENTTGGVNARYCQIYDGRIYFYGSPQTPYRLYIGGNAGNELSIARGVGGSFVDIEPGNNYIITNVLKFKTYNGATIVSVLTHNPNNLGNRYNLIETRMQVSNEVSANAYQAERVDNVTGCNSYYGSDTFADGLYATNKYGLTLTTMAMESQNQLRTTYVSEIIKNIWRDTIGNQQNNIRLVENKDMVYLAFANDEATLDNFIFVYDINLHAWYTFTLTIDDKILHIDKYQTENNKDGIIIIYKHSAYIIPTMMYKRPKTASECTVTTFIESAELSDTIPQGNTNYVHQIVLNFDYFVGEVLVEIIGTDHYGRNVHIKKTIQKDSHISNLQEYIVVGYYLTNYKLRMTGIADYCLANAQVKIYPTYSKNVGIYRGYDEYRNPANTSIVQNYYNLLDVLTP
jgi:hypothetical protein